MFNASICNPNTSHVSLIFLCHFSFYFCLSKLLLLGLTCILHRFGNYCIKCFHIIIPIPLLLFNFFLCIFLFKIFFLKLFLAQFSSSQFLFDHHSLLVKVVICTIIWTLFIRFIFLFIVTGNLNPFIINCFFLFFFILLSYPILNSCLFLLSFLVFCHLWLFILCSF